MHFPYTWQPHILDVQLFRIGNFYIAAVPSEFTTMSGRRLRNAIKNKLVEYGIGNNETTVVLSGPANGYAVSNYYYFNRNMHADIYQCSSPMSQHLKNTKCNVLKEEV